MFVRNDPGQRADVETFRELGVKLIVLRAQVLIIDIEAARRLQLRVVRVPAFHPTPSQNILCLVFDAESKNFHVPITVFEKVNFQLNGLAVIMLRQNLRSIGAGKIGRIVASDFQRIRSRVLAYDPYRIRPGPTQMVLNLLILTSLTTRILFHSTYPSHPNPVTCSTNTHCLASKKERLSSTPAEVN